MFEKTNTPQFELKYISNGSNWSDESVKMDQNHNQIFHRKEPQHLFFEWCFGQWLYGGDYIECDISVLKLLSYETFPFFYGIGFEKKLVLEKVLVSV